jgi:hypothetical protein
VALVLAGLEAPASTPLDVVAAAVFGGEQLEADALASLVTLMEHCAGEAAAAVTAALEAASDGGGGEF